MDVDFYVADQNPHRDRSLGITAYTEGLMRALHARGDVGLAALGSRSSWRPPAGVPFRALPWATDRLPARMATDLLVAGAPWGSGSLRHFPKGFLIGPRLTHRPLVGTVHDTIVVHAARRYPRARSRSAWAFWLRALRRSLQVFDLVLADSEHARLSILDWAREQGLAEPRVVTTGIGARWEERAGTRSPDPRQDEVVHLASTEPHKRTAWLVDAWGRLAERGLDLPRLVLVGPLPESTRNRVARLRHVEALPRLEEADLARRVASARALLLPSEIEGFGLPALEASYLGTPVVYRLGTAVAEVVGEGAAGGFEGDDPDALWMAVEAVLAQDPEETQRRALALRERFAWARCAERTVAAYRQVL